MSPRHHPSDETLLRYAAGTLQTGPALVVASHIWGCPDCQKLVRRFEAVGGALLDELPPTPLDADALARAMASIESADEPALPPEHGSPLPAGLEGIHLPAPLSACTFDSWRWLGPGMRASRVKLPGNRDSGVMMLRVGPGRALPDHGHTGTEWTQILHGSFSDAFGRYGPGDLAEVDEDVEHQPIVDAGGECFCLAAIDGKMRLRGLLGWLAQPFVRF
ncbi:ChrR family anti-sigma-E factor [Ancylobacter terrae]|uniref:ChrR family anti-sigma-E factor n=1 Tax=Ancylobacter sp. sgz301288 TaxID=3342077 RepID=UPI00385BB335